MERQDKIVVITLLTIIALTLIIWQIYQHQFSIPLNTITKSFFMKIANVGKKDVFDTMSNIQQYPKVLPDNVISVTIINKTDNTIFAEEEVSEAGIQTKLLVKHTIVPYREHIMEIVRGDAQGSTIRVTFDDINSSSTKITTFTELHLHGILAPFGLLEQNNLQHATDTIISKFVDYTKNHINQ